MSVDLAFLRPLSEPVNDLWSWSLSPRNPFPPLGRKARPALLLIPNFTSAFPTPKLVASNPLPPAAPPRALSASAPAPITAAPGAARASGKTQHGADPAPAATWRPKPAGGPRHAHGLMGCQDGSAHLQYARPSGLYGSSVSSSGLDRFLHGDLLYTRRPQVPYQQVQAQQQQQQRRGPEEREQQMVLGYSAEQLRALVIQQLRREQHSSAAPTSTAAALEAATAALDNASELSPGYPGAQPLHAPHTAAAVPAFEARQAKAGATGPGGVVGGRVEALVGPTAVQHMGRGAFAGGSAQPLWAPSGLLPLDQLRPHRSSLLCGVDLVWLSKAVSSVLGC